MKISDKVFKEKIAQEANVRIEYLDFYMAKFQRKTMLEMQGIDTSGFDDDIEDIMEWLRYCQWEMKNNLELLSGNEISQIYENLNLKTTVDRLIEKDINKFFIEHPNRLHLREDCKRSYLSLDPERFISITELIKDLKNSVKYKFCPYCIDDEIYESMQDFGG